LEKSTKLPNILLILVDSFNHRKIFSQNTLIPEIDKLVNSGVYFSQATSIADATLLSTTGLFTGLYPFKTGIRSPTKNLLNKNIHTFFSVLEKEGYENYAFRPTLQENDDLFPNFKNEDSLYDVFKNMSDGLGEKILDQLQKKKDKPWFLFIHPHDLHQPIIVPEEFRDEKFGISNYEKASASIDSWIGKIINQINLNETLVVITGDHGSYVKSLSVNGESIIEADGLTQLRLSQLSNKFPKFLDPIKKKVFFAMENKKQNKKQEIISKMDLTPNEKRNLLAGRFTTEHSLFDDQIRIPLIFVGYNVQKGIKITQQVRNIDIFPTIFELIGLKNNLDIDGISLKKIIDGETIKEIPAFIESNPLTIKKSNDVIGIRTSHYKYFRSKENVNDRINLYDLQDDPFENNNLATKRSDIILEMEKILQSIIGHQKI